MQTINVPPDLDTLKQIAEMTDASFFEAPTENDLRAIYQDLGSRVGFTEEEQEVTALFAGLGLVFMLFGGALAAVWFNRIP
jgi:Ca-activated chloride channel family protein